MRHANAFLLTASVVLTLTAAEAGLWLLRPLPDPYRRDDSWSLAAVPYMPSFFPPNLSWTLRAEPGLPGMRSEPIRFSVNNLGFRGDSLVIPKPRTELRIFVVGGSTTECLYLDDVDAFTHVLQKRLAQAAFGNARVYGVAKSGDRSYDHVAMIVHRLVHLEPDLVIVFAGVNDLIASLNAADYLLRRDVGGSVNRWSARKAAAVLATRLQLPRLVYAALPRTYAEAAESIAQVSRYREVVALRAGLPIADSMPWTDPTPYERNLTTIAGAARAHGFELVFVTQATTWNSRIDERVEDWQWMNASMRDGGVAYPGDWMDAAMERFNDVTRAVAARSALPLFDLADRMPKSLEFFYDDVHFNVRGAERAATLLSGFLVTTVLSPAADS